MQQSFRFLLLSLILIVSSIYIVSATPQITINSPQQTEYNSTQILLNVTSNETVNFFFKDPHTGKMFPIGENATSLNSYLYINQGSHKFTIWANNSNGETNATVLFNTTKHNPVNITECGYLISSDTAYVLNNDFYKALL